MRSRPQWHVHLLGNQCSCGQTAVFVTNSNNSTKFSVGTARGYPPVQAARSPKGSLMGMPDVKGKGTVGTYPATPAESRKRLVVGSTIIYVARASQCLGDA